MNLLELRAAHPALFAPQTWYEEEPFARNQLVAPLIGLPSRVVPSATPAWAPSAVEFVDLFVRFPIASLWDTFLWTGDVDRWGQVVFVGGRRMERGFDRAGLFQVHRWVQPTLAWGYPVWE